MIQPLNASTVGYLMRKLNEIRQQTNLKLKEDMIALLMNEIYNAQD